jgi:methionyl-tRNA synthetase
MCNFTVLLIAVSLSHRRYHQDYQLKEQCRNCTFLNGQFARECEMCGEPLSGMGNPAPYKNRGVSLY